MEETSYSQGYVIGSQKSTTDIRKWLGFGSDTWGTLIGGGGNLYFAVVVIYEDVFGERYETSVCFQVDVPLGTLTPREAGINCTNKRTSNVATTKRARTERASLPTSSPP
jgi:hypothetical protein